MLTFMMMVYEKYGIHKSRKMTRTVTNSLGKCSEKTGFRIFISFAVFLGCKLTLCCSLYKKKKKVRESHSKGQRVCILTDL